MKDELVLPRKINAANPETFGRTAEEHSSDTYNLLRKLKGRLVTLESEVDSLELALGGMTGFGSPVQGIGGGNTEGVSPKAARSDHDHTLRETTGPTDLTMGGILDGETFRRTAGAILGRQVEVKRLTIGPANRNVVTMGDVALVQLAFDLKANAQYLTFWIVFYQTAAATTGLVLSQNFTGTVNQWRFGLFGSTGATAMQSAVGTASDAPLGAVGVGPGATDRVALLFSFIRTTTAGNLALRFASGVAASNVAIQNLTHGYLIEV